MLLAGHQDLSPHRMAENLRGVTEMETPQTKPGQPTRPSLSQLKWIPFTEEKDIFSSRISMLPLPFSERIFI